MQLLAYILIYPILWLISIMPFRILYFISDCLYVLLYHIAGYRKKTVRENLKLALPEKSDEERKIIEKAFYHHLCDLILESIKSMSISEKEMKKRFVFTNVEEILKLEKINKSIILVGGHYASWEWMFIIQKYINHKGYGIYKRLRNKYFDRLAKRIRARYDTHLITTKETISTLTESKNKGELTISGFASDQSPKIQKAYHWNEFMGIKVPIHTGAEMLAKKLNMAVVFFSVKKVKRGFYETTFQTLTVKPNEFENYKITDKFMDLVEEQIKEAPEYYLWTHKRWKHRDNIPEEFK